MRRNCPVLMLALLIAQSSSAMPARRFLGLDRLYFEHIAGLGDKLVVSRSLAAALPEQIDSANINGMERPAPRLDRNANIIVRDFVLPLQREPGKLLLRQVVQELETLRITDLWWALYDDGRRTDVWYFQADPRRTENKALYNYEIDRASALADGSLTLRVHGTMFRPQGAWWITEKILSFTIRGNTLYLSRVQTKFDISQDYDFGDVPPAVSVSTEREVDGRIETRTSENVPDNIRDDCGFPESLLDDDGEIKWKIVSRAALCVTQKSLVQLSFRGLSDPSFVERGGK